MFQCPICGELMEILTNNHCVNKHNLTKKELLDRYGTPKYVTPTMSREVQNWIRESTIITRMDFDIAQAAARSQRRG
jgi:isopenicillin N synthase-like dioxygenase